MQHAFIVSEPCLQLVAEENYHLILPHLYTDHPRYVQFYKQQHIAGAHIVQDNSTFELKDNAGWEFLMLGVRENFITEIIVPERLRDASESLDLHHKFLNKYGSEIKKAGVKISAVIQGQCVEELTTHFVELCRDSDIYRIFIPFNFEFDAWGNNVVGTKKYESGLNRFELVCEIITKSLDLYGVDLKPIHLLGMFNPVEMTLYNSWYKEARQKYFTEYWNRLLEGKQFRIGQDLAEILDRQIVSNDSSCCFWHSLHGVSLSANKGLLYKKIKSHVDFKQDFQWPEQRFIFDTNMKIIKEFCDAE